MKITKTQNLSWALCLATLLLLSVGCQIEQNPEETLDSFEFAIPVDDIVTQPTDQPDQQIDQENSCGGLLEGELERRTYYSHAETYYYFSNCDHLKRTEARRCQDGKLRDWTYPITSCTVQPVPQNPGIYVRRDRLVGTHARFVSLGCGSPGYDYPPVAPGSTYQWYEQTDTGLESLSGETGYMISFSNPREEDSGTYVCYSDTGFDDLVLKVSSKLTVTKAPVFDVNGMSGSAFAFYYTSTVLSTTIAGGEYPMTYQWYFTPQGGVEVPVVGETTLSLEIPVLNADSRGTYRVEATNSYGSSSKQTTPRF